jgi:hypothetical protein
MKGLIDKEGYLFLYRNKKLIRQYCNFTHGISCGHNCSLFGEPEERIQIELKEKKIKTKLELCIKTIYFEDFNDERNKI